MCIYYWHEKYVWYQCVIWLSLSLIFYCTGGGGGGGGPCYAFQRGECQRGNACRFGHE